jgi:hypothetical protein
MQFGAIFHAEAVGPTQVSATGVHRAALRDILKS